MNESFRGAIIVNDFLLLYFFAVLPRCNQWKIQLRSEVWCCATTCLPTYARTSYRKTNPIPQDYHQTCWVSYLPMTPTFVFHYVVVICPDHAYWLYYIHIHKPLILNVMMYQLTDCVKNWLAVIYVHSYQHVLCLEPEVPCCSIIAQSIFR